MGKSKLDRANKFIKSQGFENNVLRFIPDISHIKVKPDENKRGYFITIVQDIIEATDIIDYFTDRFNKRFSKKNEKNKIVFEGYSQGDNKGKKVSIIRFYYRANLFERKLLFKSF